MTNGGAATQKMKSTLQEAGPEPPVQKQRPKAIVRRIRRAYLSLCRCGNTVFRDYQITTDQFALIRAVQRAPGIRQSELCEELFADANTITAMVSLLERRGVLRRQVCKEDARARRLFVTAKGNRLMQALSAEWEPFRELLFKCFEGPDGEQALELMDRLCEMMLQCRKQMLEGEESPAAVDRAAV